MSYAWNPMRMCSVACMARMGRSMGELTLADDERESLVRWSRRAASAQALAQRCRTVFGRAEGKSNQQVAAEFGIWPQAVGKWRRHCARPGERTS
ncbi:hypothetical protein [Streptomyces albus]|uniref:hypothetical protein n=1 Tax=Streptomyces albus TaxID=1888 RepID=UPI0004C4CFA5|nr:hypothetical protein [Streptomyces albus]GHJ24107.1 hypothetical protein TPA0909_57210 [Streptomyces albus]